MDKPKRNKTKQISYAEVDSDVDLPSDEEKKFEDQLDSKGNKRRRKRVKEDDSDVDDTTETTTTKKKNNKQDKSSTRKKKHKYDSKMLLELPFDIFAELCTHLDYKDLISLAKVNKSLHKILLSRAARPIFAGIRKRDGFPLPGDMSELGFVILLVGASCEGCGTRSYLKRSLFLRNCLCKECLPKYVISSRKLAAKWPELHSRAIECVRFDQDCYTETTLKNSRSAQFLISDLAEVDRELHDAEADDEIDAMVLETEQDRNKRSSSRRRLGAVQTDSVAISQDSSQNKSRVVSYVEEKQKWVKKEQKASLKIVAVERERQVERYERLSEIRSKRRSEREELFDSYTIELEELDWSPEDIGACLDPFLYCYRDPPKASPLANTDHWINFLTRCKPSRRDDETVSKLYDSLDLFYDALQFSEAPRHHDIFPTFTEFRNFEAARSYLEDEKSKPLTKSLWLKLLPSILEELGEYYKAIRIEAIRSILAAQQGVSITKISASRNAYPESLYPDSFFNLATSLFPPPRYQSIHGLLPYPQAVTNVSRRWRGKGSFSRRAESRTTMTIQAIVRAAGLDPAKTTAADLDLSGRRFTWDNDTMEEERDTLKTWRQLVKAVVARGSDNTKYKDASATTIVSYFPQVDVHGFTYLDEEGDGPGELVESGEEEGDGEGQGERSAAEKTDEEEEFSEEEE
ncbi:hypothetical protein JCM5350_006516 [Sporobolomyces pararoseus]